MSEASFWFDALVELSRHTHEKLQSRASRSVASTIQQTVSAELSYTFRLVSSLLTYFYHDMLKVINDNIFRKFEGGSAYIERWLNNKDAVLFPCVWEQINNAEFNSLEFGGIKNELVRDGIVCRLWHSRILTRWHPAFASLPLDSVICDRQSDYYDASRTADSIGASTPFIEFLLEAIPKFPEYSSRSDPEGDPVSDPVARLLRCLSKRSANSSEIMSKLGLRHRASLREHALHPALSAGLIGLTLPDTPTSRNQKYRLSARGKARLGAVE